MGIASHPAAVRRWVVLLIDAGVRTRQADPDASPADDRARLTARVAGSRS
jgi:hypothetical protein